MITRYKILEGTYGFEIRRGAYLTGDVKDTVKSEIKADRDGILSCLTVVGDKYALLRYDLVDDGLRDETSLHIALVSGGDVKKYSLHYDGRELNRDYYKSFVKDFVISLSEGEDIHMSDVLEFLSDHNLLLYPDGEEPSDPFEGYPDGIIVIGE